MYIIDRSQFGVLFFWIVKAVRPIMINENDNLLNKERSIQK